MFQKGNKKARGGKRPGAGRKPKVREQSQADLTTREAEAAFERIVERAKGKREPDPVAFACDKLILEYAWGKPTQRLQHSGEMSFVTHYGPDAPTDAV